MSCPVSVHCDGLGCRAAVRMAAQEAVIETMHCSVVGTFFGLGGGGQKFARLIRAKVLPISLIYQKDTILYISSLYL